MGWDEASSAYKDTGVSPANYVLTKSEVERVLTGGISSHTHAYLPLAGGTMANTNLVTNLNADKLDGSHLADILSSNVASATKLNTKHYIWSQGFDGTSDIAGYFYQDNNTGIYMRDSSATSKNVLVLSSSNNFFTCKSTIAILLYVYRLSILSFNLITPSS